MDVKVIHIKFGAPGAREIIRRLFIECVCESPALSSLVESISCCFTIKEYASSTRNSFCDLILLFWLRRRKQSSFQAFTNEEFRVDIHKGQYHFFARIETLLFNSQSSCILYLLKFSNSDCEQIFAASHKFMFSMKKKQSKQIHITMSKEKNQKILN
ncbi:hypothetical protein FF38_00599 [Lucilia cuprina]|uniref:Uncharacterized protein n=1 Tax=Lucilia cuprina TaxID=7375 RepID=A0A0L0C1Q8_LUCCU|nr:hypothetical protein FF38_00599 [Lucilia cuprina]